MATSKSPRKSKPSPPSNRKGRTKRLSEAKRNRIVELADAGKSRNDIARQLGVSAGSVTRIAHAAGRAFDRSKTKNACEARKVDLAELRTELREQLLIEAFLAMAELHAPAIVYDFTKEGEFVTGNLAEPLFKDKQSIMTRVAIAIDKDLKLEGVDSETGSKPAVVELVERLRGMQRK